MKQRCRTCGIEVGAMHCDRCLADARAVLATAAIAGAVAGMRAAAQPDGLSRVGDALRRLNETERVVGVDAVHAALKLKPAAGDSIH